MGLSSKGLEEGVVITPPDDDMKPVPGQLGDLPNSEVHRGLSSRHVQFLALGGCIGTGLFVGSGQSLSTVGPGKLVVWIYFRGCVYYRTCRKLHFTVRLLSRTNSFYSAFAHGIYCHIYCRVFIMNILGEMTTYLPMRGVSVPYFINRFTEPSLGFAIGYNYWYSFAMLTASEVTAAGLVIQYWPSSVTVGVWITIVLFASLKIIAIIGLIIVGVILFFGGGPNYDRLGFRYWENPGAFVEPYLVPNVNTGRFLAFWTALIKSGFSFIFSPELIATTAGEAVSPRRNIPKATNRLIYHLFTFYVMGTLVIGNDKNLLQGVASGGSGASASPFEVGIQNAGIGLNHVINAAILTSAWSSGTLGSMLYHVPCTPWHARVRHTKIFTRCTKDGVPYVVVLITWAIGLLSYLNLSNSGSNAFYWFTNITTVGGFISWVLVGVAYLRFRRALDVHGLLDSRPFKTPFQPRGVYYAIVVVSLLAITNGYTIFFPGAFTASGFLVSYVVFAIFFVLYFDHKIWYRTPWMVPAADIDIFFGREEIDRLCEEEVEKVPRNWLQRFWWWIA
ncbi:uncharacterized protein N7458_002146 [Penicillium daleae]|uniref:Amino acid permease/ SLC12A domain-containing protein n=1 Tax=Penicillium daleae TaxID=63821 RepID=A0AAD6CD05_9EURO|nr:uncharacterized protein N7458_002146 [Penicillium daleae]KAJ5460594.1 hypothetical protein N7458_002146 [Penicillium daleae]